MPCTPIDLDSIILPPSTINGLSVPQLPAFDIPFNSLPVQDLTDLFNTLNLIVPPGTLRPQLSPQFSKNMLDAIVSLLQNFMPFLMMYTFFMPILNMILCIIEIICALTNPFKLIKAISRLFRVCIPEFLALFPAFALIVMILSLLLLILALILYLIQRIIAIIRQIIAEINLLAEAVHSANSDSIIAITIKLGDFLCLFQNLFVILGVIIIIFQIIDRLRKLSFKLPPCDDSDGSDSGCCTPDVCPSFIKNNKEISAATGILDYHNNIINTSAGSNVLRQSSFQFYDPSLAENLHFNNITHAFDLPHGVTRVFFPEGETFTGTTTPNRVPYTLDIRFFYDPTTFGRTDIKGARFVRVRDSIVLKPPVDGVSDYHNSVNAPNTGTFFISGGQIWEDDNITIVQLDGNTATLDTLLHFPDITGVSPILSIAGTLHLTNLTYTLKINHISLIENSLITVGCHPDVAFDKNFINNTLGTQLNNNAAALNNLSLPDTEAMQECIINAVNQFRQSISIESATQLEDTVVNCLNKLQDQTSQAAKDVIDMGVDSYKSDFTIDPTIQFTTKPIDVTVILNEGSGNSITNNLTTDIASSIGAKISAISTLGSVTSFSYDGTSKFHAQLSSKISGNGTIKVSYNGQFISILNNPTDTTQTPTVTTKELLYTFVESAGASVQPAVERNESDIAREGV